MTDLLNDLIAFFEARNTGNATNDLLNRCKKAQSKQLLIPRVVSSALKVGDIIEISGYYFDWEVKEGYSHVLKQTGIYATSQGGLIHTDLVGSLILRINGKKVV